MNVLRHLVIALLLATPVQAAISVAETKTASGAGSATTIPSGSITIAAGAAVIAHASFFGDATTIAIAGDNGEGSLTCRSVYTHELDANDATGAWCVVASADGGATDFTATFGAARTARRIVVYELAGVTGTLTFAAEANATSESSGTITTGDVSTTQDNSIGLCASMSDLTQTVTSRTIDELAADGSVDPDQFTVTWFEVFTSAMTGDCDGSNDRTTWAAMLIVYEDVPVGGGPPSQVTTLGAGT